MIAYFKVLAVAASKTIQVHLPARVSRPFSFFCFKKFLQFLKKNIIQFLIENKIILSPDCSFCRLEGWSGSLAGSLVGGLEVVFVPGLS